VLGSRAEGPSIRDRARPHLFRRSFDTWLGYTLLTWLCWRDCRRPHLGFRLGLLVGAASDADCGETKRLFHREAHRELQFGEKTKRPSAGDFRPEIMPAMASIKFTGSGPDQY